MEILGKIKLTKKNYVLKLNVGTQKDAVYTIDGVHVKNKNLEKF